MRSILCAFIAIVSISGAFARAASAPPMSDQVPDDAIIYFGWSGAEAFAAAPEYQQSHLKALLDNSNMRQVAQELIPKLLAKAAQQGGEEAATAVDTFKLVGGTLWNYPSAAYFTVEMGNGNPMPHGAIFSRAGKDALTIQKRMDELLAQLNAPPEARVMTFVVDDIVGVSVGYEDAAMALAGPSKAKPISGNHNFKSALAKLGGGDATSVAYIDFEAAIKLVDAGIRMHGEPDVQEKWPAIREATGIGGLRRVAMLSGFDGKGWSHRIFVDAPRPRKGLLAIADPSPLPDELIKMIPVSATSAMAGGFDIARAIAEINTILGDVDPNVQEKFNQVLGAAQMYTGVNLESDLFASLGEHWAIYEDPTIAGSGFLGMVGVNKLRDPAKAQRSLNGLSAAITNTLAGLLRKQKVEVAIRTVASGDITVSYIAVPFVSPSWTIKDGYLYFALYPQNALTAAKRGAPAKSILDNPAYTSVRDKLKVEKPTSIEFSDLPRAAENNYQSLLVVTRMGLGFADLFGVRAPELVIPPLDELIRHLEPAGGMSWSDDNGFYYRSVSPFPGSQLLNGPGAAGAAAPAFMASILLPSLNRARETANRVKCASNERQIGQAILLYSNDNKGKYPPDLGTLVVTEDITPEVFICPNSNTRVPKNWPQMNDQQKIDWVNSNSSFIYLGAGMDNSQPADAIVLYEQDRDHGPDGMNMLYGDGHVEFNFMDPAKKAIQSQRGR
ncbi:hypothetical protein BH09PLA1_BH09PLA1_10950 [soil metagenome]